MRATLGNDVFSNSVVYGLGYDDGLGDQSSQRFIKKYENDKTITTVIYKNNVSTLETITYKEPITVEDAKDAVKHYILPEYVNTQLVESKKVTVGNSVIEHMVYTKGIRIALIMNREGQVVKVMGFVRSVGKLLK